MSTPESIPPLLRALPPLASPERTLRKLFLTLFLRGRGARGLRKESAPRSVGSKLALTLLFYAMFGLVALTFMNQPIFTLAVYLHAMTLMFLGMFVAASAGEVLFNKEEGDILLHRPVTARALLWAKVGVLIQVSLWLAGAFNLVGLFVGASTAAGSWRFPIAHVISTVTEALFCTGSVVLVYQLCLRWFGRERLDGLMTTAQVFMAVAVVGASQAVPHLMRVLGGKLSVSLDAWWIWILPPAWFAGFDDALAGSSSASSWVLAGLGLTTTAVVAGLAFGKLADEYQAGLQMLNESPGTTSRRGAQRRWFDRMVNAPPLRWWMKNSVTRAAFLLTAAYLVRDRDTKLRIYPGVAPMLIMPLVFLFQDRGANQGGFGIAFAGTFLGLVPMLALNLLQFSQQWQAADVFRAAPIPGPGPICEGARRAVLCLLTVPVLIFYGLVFWLAGISLARLALFVPGLIALPIYALVPSIGGKAVPLSMASEESKSANRGLQMIGIMLISMALAGITIWSWAGGWFRWLIVSEIVVAVPLYAALRAWIARARWAPID